VLTRLNFITYKFGEPTHLPQ